MSFLSYLINGISLGSVYAIIALGYTMVYGIARMLNFAHGDIIMVGGFTVFTTVSYTHLDVYKRQTHVNTQVVCQIYGAGHSALVRADNHQVVLVDL